VYLQYVRYGTVFYARKFATLEAFKKLIIKIKIYLRNGDIHTSKCFASPNNMNNNGSAVVPVIQNIIVINIVNLSRLGSYCQFDVHLFKKIITL
jgi:hypothetical protein